jgi:hypothetical protein
MERERERAFKEKHLLIRKKSQFEAMISKIILMSDWFDFLSYFIHFHC